MNESRDSWKAKAKWELFCWLPNKWLLVCLRITRRLNFKLESLQKTFTFEENSSKILDTFSPFVLQLV